MAVAMLERETETYEQRRDELLGSALGKWVLIRGEEIGGTFDTQGDAIAAGYQQYGNVPFLVKQVLPFDTPQSFVSNHLAF